MAAEFDLTQPGIIDTIVAQSAWAWGFTRQNQRLNATLFYLITAVTAGGGPTQADAIALIMQLVKQDRSYWVAKRDSSPVEINTAFDQAVVLAGYTGTKDAVKEWRFMQSVGGAGFDTPLLAAAIDIVRTQLQVP